MALLVLVIGSTAAHADLVFRADSRSDAGAAVLPLTEAQLGDRVTEARATLVAAAGRVATDGLAQHLAYARAMAERDPPRREALIFVWLKEFVGPAPLDEPIGARLRRLLGYEPVVFVQHHDHPGRTQPAFNIDGLARNRLAEQRVRLRALELAKRPERIQAALLAPDQRFEFDAALLALDAATPDVRASVLHGLESEVFKRPTAARATLALVERNWVAAGALLGLVEGAEPSVAIEALRISRARDPGLHRDVLQVALRRAELGGLPIGDAARTGDPDLLDSIWTLLGDTDRGGDAALALARHAHDLEARIDADFDRAQPAERLRMLLALKLRNTPQSLDLLQSLREQRVEPSERHAIEAWR